MRKPTLILGLAILAIAVWIGWQLASIKLNNIEFRDDLRDIATQRGANIGLVGPKTEEEIRGQVVRAAAEHGFDLPPDQVALQQYTDLSKRQIWYDITVDYTARLNLLVYSRNFHFTQSNK